MNNARAVASRVIHRIIGTDRRPEKYRTACGLAIPRHSGDYVYTTEHWARISCPRCLPRPE